MFKKYYLFILLSCLVANTAGAIGLTAPLGVPQPAELTLVRHQQTLELPEEIKNFMKQSNVSAENLSVYIRDLNANVPMVLHNDKVPRNPASTMKLVTTWTALKLLSPSFTWKTQAWARGSIKNGVLAGDLVLKGYGDPFLTEEFFWQLLNELRLKGLKEIQGNLIIDNSYFTAPAQNAADFDGEPARVYNAIPSALMYSFQATRLLFEPDDEHQRINITVFPEIPSLQIDNQLKYIAGSCQRQHYKPAISQTGNVLKLSGSYASGCGKNAILRMISPPEEHVYNAFRDMWQLQGGVFKGKWQSGTVQAGDVLLHTHESRSLGEQIRFINKWSNNVMARQLFLTIGAQKLGEPATIDKSRLVTADVLQKAGIDYQGMVLENGSGLSRVERVSASQMGQLLEAVWRDPYMPEFMASMPLLGEDGTLADRFKNDDLRGRSHMKTGTLNDATAIAGYMLTRSGKRLVIVLQFNGPQAQGGGRLVQDTILKWAFEQ